MNSGNLFYYVKITRVIYIFTNSSSSNNNISRTRLELKKCTSSVQVTLITDLILILIRSIIPIIFMLVMNVCIVRKLTESALTWKEASSNSSTSRRCRTRDHQFTLTVTWLNLVFVLFNLPTTVFYLVKSLHVYRFDDGLSYTVLAELELFWNISYAFANVYYALCFVLN